MRYSRCVHPPTEVALSTTVKNKPAWQGLVLGVGVKNIRKMIRVRMNIPFADGNPLVMAFEVLKVKSVVFSREGASL